MGNFLVR